MAELEPHGQRQALRLHAFVGRSHANGPGARAVLWTQGCRRRCPGCFNPDTHPHTGGVLVAVDALAAGLAARAAANPSLEGVTLSGGEPLEQLEPLLALLRRLRRDTALSTLLFTGYTWDEMLALPHADALLTCLDVVIAGPYDPSQHLGAGLLGSANQTVYCLTSRYSTSAVAATPPAEAILMGNGEVVWSGVGS